MIGRAITILIIAINGFFVAAEFALVKVRGSQIDVLIKQGDTKATLVKVVADQLDDYLSACQLGITITSLALGWVAEPLIASQFLELNTIFSLGLTDITAHAIAIPITFIILTILHIVLGELAPKSLAIRDPLKISRLVIQWLYWFYIIFKPFIHFLNSLSLIFLRLFGVQGGAEEQSHSEEELRMIVAESEADGHINASERDLIQNVFDFDNRQVSEIMTPAHKAFTYDIKNRNKESVHQLMDEGYSRIPFYEGNINNIIGRVLLKDILHSYIKSSDNLTITSLIRPMQFVPENMKIDDCLKHLQTAHYHMAVVTSEYGTTLGIVTMEDILEELVGDIHDESDEKQAIVTYVDNLYIIDASASVNDVNEHLPIALPESDSYDTVAGYINTVFGRIPSQNETITTETYTITITKRKKQRIEQIALRLLSSNE